MKYEFLFLDLDNTILDFHKAEYYALGKTLSHFGLEPTDYVRGRYSVINRAHWDMLERMEITRDQVLVGRYEVLLKEFGLRVDSVECARFYEHCITHDDHYFLPGADTALAELSKNYKLYLATNGTLEMQHGKLKNLGIKPYFEKLFISEELGTDKPDVKFFEGAFAQIPGFDKCRALMVGDSLGADISGGIAAGIDTCWINPDQKPGDLQPTYQLRSLAQLPGLLKSL